jgi:hypothetical protein
MVISPIPCIMLRGSLLPVNRPRKSSRRATVAAGASAVTHNCPRPTLVKVERVAAAVASHQATLLRWNRWNDTYINTKPKATVSDRLHPYNSNGNDALKSRG